jgi:hypothetical protein
LGTEKPLTCLFFKTGFSVFFPGSAETVGTFSRNEVVGGAEAVSLPQPEAARAMPAPTMYMPRIDRFISNSE